MNKLFLLLTTTLALTTEASRSLALAAHHLNNPATLSALTAAKGAGTGSLTQALTSAAVGQATHAIPAMQVPGAPVAAVAPGNPLAPMTTNLMPAVQQQQVPLPVTAAAPLAQPLATVSPQFPVQPQMQPQLATQPAALIGQPGAVPQVQPHVQPPVAAAIPQIQQPTAIANAVHPVGFPQVQQPIGVAAAPMQPVPAPSAVIPGHVTIAAPPPAPKKHKRKRRRGLKLGGLKKLLNSAANVGKGLAASGLMGPQGQAMVAAASAAQNAAAA